MVGVDVVELDIFTSFFIIFRRKTFPNATRIMGRITIKTIKSR